MTLEWKTFGVVWHARCELLAITGIMCFVKLMHLHMLTCICFTIQFLGRGVFGPFLTQIVHHINHNVITKPSHNYIILRFDSVLHCLAPQKESVQIE
jgi:hypothetical protein